MDVKEGIRNADRELLEEVQRSPWAMLSQRLLLLLNKLDTLEAENEDEVEQDPDDVVAGLVSQVDFHYNSKGGNR